MIQESAFLNYNSAMPKPARHQARKRSGGGKATAGGVSFQAQIAAWVAVHILAQKPVKQSFGLLNDAYPELVGHETEYAVDDLYVRFAPQGRLFIQATTDLTVSFKQSEQSKLEKTLVQGLKTWETLRQTNSSGFKQPLDRLTDAVIIAIPHAAPQTLEDLQAAFRSLDQITKWEDAPTGQMNQRQVEALTDTADLLRQSAATTLTDNELLEVISLFRLVRFGLALGEPDYQQALDLLQAQILAENQVATQAWAYLLQNSLHLTSKGSPSDRDGLIRLLTRGGFKLRFGVSVQAFQLGQTAATTHDSGKQPHTRSINPAENLLYPPHLADGELPTALRQTRQRAMFNDPSVNYVNEVVGIAQRALVGDLQLAAGPLRADAAQYAARALALNSKDAQSAEKLIAQAKQVYPGGDFQIAAAAILYLTDQNAAIRALRSIPSPEARSQLFFFQRAQDAKLAIQTIQSNGLTPKEYTSFGVNNILITAVQLGDFEFALSWADRTTAENCAECPSLYSLRAQVNLAACATGTRSELLAGLPLDLTGLHLSEDSASMKRRREAVADLDSLLPILNHLGLKRLHPRIEELLLFLKLEDTATRADTREAVRIIVSANPSLTIDFIRILLRFDIPFDETALKEQLDEHRKFGGWSPDEAFAALALQLGSKDPKNVASFLSEYGNDIKSAIPNPDALIVLEIEVKAKSGDVADAKNLLKEKENLLPSETRARLVEIIEEQEGRSDPLDNAKKRYATRKNLDDLRSICGLLEQRKDFSGLSTYAGELAERTRTLADLKGAIDVLFHVHQYSNALALIDHLSEIHNGDQSIAELQAHAYFFTGQVNRTAHVLNQAFQGSLKPRIIQLEIFTSLERGDWEHLRSIVERIANNSDKFEPIELVRLAHVAGVVGSSYVDSLLQAALSRAADDPHIYLAAYTHAMQSGKEDEESYKHFEKAFALSGPDGPVQQRPLQELAEMFPGWREHEERVNNLFREGDAPLFIAARALNVTMTHAALGRALANAKSSDARRKVPVLAFHGDHKPLTLTAVNQRNRPRDVSGAAAPA
jgi:hypothetical protein